MLYAFPAFAEYHEINHSMAAKKQAGRKILPRTQFMRERSAQLGVAASTLAHWENSGCNLDDDDSIRAYLAKLTRLPQGLKDEWKPQSENLEETPDIAFLKDQLLRTQDERDARRIKTQIDGLLSAQKLEVLNNSYISVIDVKEAYIKLGSIIRAGIMRLQADLPPVLEGLEPSQMAKRISESADKLLTELSDSASELWQND